MYAVSDERRSLLMRVSVMTVCGGLAILPFTVAPTSTSARAQAVHRAQPIAVPDVPGRLLFPSISIERDPFVPDESVISKESALSSSSNAASDADIGIVLPANAGARGGPPIATASGVPVVRGIILGDTSEALVDLGSGVKVVRVGDLLGSDTVRAIDSAGITLSSGLHLRISGGKQ